VGIGLFRRDLLRRANAVELGHHQIHQDDIGMQFIDLRHRLLPIARFSDDFDIGLSCKKCSNAFTYNSMIVT
jgi:hypothetical protein